MIGSRALSLLALPLTGGCLGNLGAPLDQAEQHEWVGALGFWYAEDSAQEAAGEREVVDLRRQRCEVRKLDDAEAAFFRRSTAYAAGVLSSPELGAMMEERTRWELTPDSGAQIMARLRGSGAEISVFVVDRDAGHPCQAEELVDGSTHAFTPMSAEGQPHLLFLYEGYLASAMKSVDVRGLARTLVHEALHSLGYSHAGLPLGSARYSGSVPVYVGCAVEHWGGPAEQAWIKDNCPRASKP